MSGSRFAHVEIVLVLWLKVRKLGNSLGVMLPAAKGFMGRYWNALRTLSR